MTSDQPTADSKAELSRRRTLRVAVRIVRLCRTLPSNVEGRIVAGQLIRSATSIGANYRAACRARSKREFIAKLGIVIEESDETLFWLELIAAIWPANDTRLNPLRTEVNELLSIFVAGSRTARQSLRSAVPPAKTR